MLKTRILYALDGGPETAILESPDLELAASVAEQIVWQYLQAAEQTDDKVLATLIQQEAMSAIHTLEAAGLTLNLVDLPG